MLDLIQNVTRMMGVDANRKEVFRMKKCEDVGEVESFEAFIEGSGIGFDVEQYNREQMNDKLCNGMYARVLFIREGDFLTGRIHKEPYIDIFVSGEVKLISYLEDGTVEPMEVIDSLRILEGKPGRKRVLEAVKDTVWITVDRFDLADDIGKVRRYGTFRWMSEYSEFAKKLKESV